MIIAGKVKKSAADCEALINICPAFLGLSFTCPGLVVGLSLFYFTSKIKMTTTDTLTEPTMATDTDIMRIKLEAKYGDYTTIGSAHGLKADTVRRIARGTRNNEAVMASFIELLDNRKAQANQPQA